MDAIDWNLFTDSDDHIRSDRSHTASRITLLSEDGVLAGAARVSWERDEEGGPTGALLVEVWSVMLDDDEPLVVKTVAGRGYACDNCGRPLTRWDGCDCNL